MKRPLNRKPPVVPGFSFAAASAGIKQPGKNDVALLFSNSPAVAAGVFTTNNIKAAPVKLAIENITSHKGQAVIINSGNANACTGSQGLKDALHMADNTSRALGLPREMVYVSSTGVIGRKLPVKKIDRVIPELAKNLSPSSMDEAASAIMTTDTFPKVASRQIKIGSKTGTIAGMAKGAGMICPKMATMLCFIVTDIAVSPGALDNALRKAVSTSFNRLSIDNDMSTNDTVLIMANGALGNRTLTGGSPMYKKFMTSLKEVTYDLARLIAIDGEGATKLVEIKVEGARTEADAEKAAFAVANSMLVKTAIYGKDPNWGRIIAAVGYSGAKLNEQKTGIFLNNVKLVSKGIGTGKEKTAAGLLSENEIHITVNLGAGTRSAKVLTCDLTEEYIKINAHYTT